MRGWMVGGLIGCSGGGVVADGAATLDEGQLDAAIETWSAATARGPASGIVEYNVGTAWLRRGDAPRAIVHLRAAGARRPRDGAVNHNLALARAELGAVPPPVGLARGWMSVVTPGELAGLGWLVVAVGSGLVFAHARRETEPVWTSAMGLGGLGLVVAGLVTGTIAMRGAADHAAHPVAVVASATAPLRLGPSVDAASETTLRQGSEVRLELQRGDFWLVVDGRTRRGWVAAAALVYPLGFDAVQ